MVFAKKLLQFKGNKRKVIHLTVSKNLLKINKKTF